MAKSVKGLIVEIGGDTSGLQNALKKVTKDIGSVSQELREINKALKFDTKNPELLAQKQQALAKETALVSKELRYLEEEYDDINGYMQKGNILTEDQQKRYEALAREIVFTREKLKELQIQGSKWTDASEKLANFSKTTGKLGDICSNVAKKMAGLTAGIIGFATYGVKYNAELEKYHTALVTLTGSAEKADKIIAQIKEDAKTTPFDVQGLVQANQLLLSTGLDAEESRNTILALGNAISATGGGNEELSRMAINLQQIKNVGKASALDIKQFAYAGIDIYGLLADYMGITKEEASSMEVTWENLNGALIKASEEGGKYFEAMSNQSTTLNGQVSNLKDAFGQLSGSLTQNLVPIVKKVLDYLNDLMNRFNSLDENTRQMITSIALIVAGISPLLFIMSGLFGAVSKISSAFSLLFKIIPKILAIFKVLSPIIAGLNLPLIAIVSAITAVIAGFVLLYNKCEWFRDGVNNIISTVYEFFKTVMENIKIFFTQTIPSWINLLVNEILPKLPYYIGYAIGWIIGEIAKFIANVWNTITTKVPEIISKIVEFVSELPSKLWVWFSETLVKVIQFLADWLSNIQENIPKIISAIVDKFIELPSKMLEIGQNIVHGLWNGILAAKDWLIGKIGEFASGILQGMKDALGIHSPSTLFRDEVRSLYGRTELV